MRYSSQVVFGFYGLMSQCPRIPAEATQNAADILMRFVIDGSMKTAIDSMLFCLSSDAFSPISILIIPAKMFC